MKKRKLSILGLLVCLLVIGGCSNGKSQSSGESKSSASVTSTTKSSSNESSKPTESTTKSSTSTSEASASANSKAFQYMLQGAQSQIPSLKEQMGGMYKDISVTEGDANTMIFTYTFAQEAVTQVDMEALKPVLVNQVGSMLSSVQSLIDDLKFKFVFLNPDGSEIGSMTITSDDVAAAETESTGS